MPLEDGEWEDDIPVTIDEQTAEDADQGTHSQGPGSVEQDSAPFDTEPQRVTEAEESASEEPPEDEPIPEFDPAVYQEFEGLLYLGKLQRHFTKYGHKFVIRTMNVGEVVEAGMIHKDYIGTLADIKAYQAAVAAACVVTVDNKPLPIPITNEETALITRFSYIMEHWFPPTLDAIYEEYLLLERDVERVLEAMEKAHGWTGSTRTLSGTAV